MNLYRSTFFALYLLDFFLFGMKITDYTLDITNVYACKLRNIHCISNIFKIQLFFHFVKFELLIGDFTFSVVNPIFVQKYIVQYSIVS